MSQPLNVTGKKQTKILLIGAKGQLGRTITALDSDVSIPSNWNLQGCSRSQLDITDGDSVESYLSQINPDVIINAAAYTAVDLAESNKETAYLVNEKAVENIANWVASNSANLVHISTDFVFSGDKNSPYTTEDNTDPKSVYGQSKLAGENIIRKLIPTQATIIRTAWLYSEYGNNFVKTMLRLMNEKKNLGVVSDQLGTPSSTHTLTRCVYSVINKNSYGNVFHCTDMGQASWFDFAVAIQEEALSVGLLKNAIPLSPLTTAEYPLPAKRPANSILDKSKTSEQLDIQLKPWRAELRKIVEIINNSIQT